MSNFNFSLICDHLYPEQEARPCWACGQELVDRWRAGVIRGLVRRSNNSTRPDWVKSRSKGLKICAIDLYKSDVHADMKDNGELEGCDPKQILPVVTAAAVESWPSEHDDKKAEYEARATKKIVPTPMRRRLCGV